jgi:undecaprenyl-diphosphatase
MSWLETIIIAIVEGLTEFLPVSSTGHMIITEALLGVKSTAFVKAFTVIVQFGAILSILVLYWRRFLQGIGFYGKLFIAFLPAAVVGLLLGDQIDALLESVEVVAVALIGGGFLMLFVDQLFRKQSRKQAVTSRKAFIIGLCQCVALIPGVSRSMATIVGGMSQRLTRRNAAEFSFFLAVPTMFAASAYKLVQLLADPAGRQLLVENTGILIVGNVIAFVVALLAVRFFIEFISRYGFKAFGYYRIVVGTLLLILLFTGHQLQIV